MRTLLSVLMLLSLAGCGGRAATLDEAKAVIQAAYPTRVAVSRLVQTTDLGNRWRLIYLSETTAGQSYYEVDKRTGAIVNAVMGQ